MACDQTESWLDGKGWDGAAMIGSTGRRTCGRGWSVRGLRDDKVGGVKRAKTEGAENGTEQRQD